VAGFYRSAYKAPDGSGETRHMAVTQFEPTDARRCFPCWDEPALKATFKMALCVPQDRVALSNMPEESTEEVIIIMVDASTYLLSWGWLWIETKPTPPPAICAM
jgi:hypothetical protein